MKNSEHPESNQGPFDTSFFYSRTLYQLSYVRATGAPKKFLSKNSNRKKNNKITKTVPGLGIEPRTSRSSV